MPSSVQIFNQAISQFKLLQGQLVDKQGKIAADSKADTFAGLGDDLPVIQSFKLSIERSERYINSIKDGQRKNDVLYQSMQQLIDIARNFKQNLAIENSAATQDTNNITQIGNSALDNIRGALNLRDGTNYVFSGSKTNVEPVGDLKASSNIQDDAETASYYNGDNFLASIDVSNSLTVEYGISAADPAFQKLIGAINMAKTEEGNGTENFAQVGEMLDDAIDGLIALQAKIGDNAKLFETSTEFHTKTKESFETQYDAVNAPDIVQLTIETTQLQATLQASFAAFAKITQLSLTNFL